MEYALSKVGYPYSQDLRDSGTHFDCSSLAYYAWQNAGVNIMYEGANTAAAESKFCYDHNYLVNYEEMQPGDLIFYSYSKNGRFFNITHVAIYVGNGMVVEAANERIGVVYRPVQSRFSIVFIGRPRYAVERMTKKETSDYESELIREYEHWEYLKNLNLRELRKK